MKKYIYITAFMSLGILVGFLIHALIEIPATTLLISNFEKWGFGLSWDSWESIHVIGSIGLLIFGGVFGFRQGKYWWQIIYG